MDENVEKRAKGNCIFGGAEGEFFVCVLRKERMKVLFPCDQCYILGGMVGLWVL
jgi:hypothetical protein